MGIATLGRPDDTLTFRIDPDEVKWNWKINTSVQDTVGGRVVQIVGATLSDLVVSGHYGEDHNLDASKKQAGTDSGPGRSWVLAEKFIRRVRRWMDYQSSQNMSGGGLSNPPLRFTYPPYKWDFSVYIKDISDSGGPVISHDSGKFSYTYSLTLFILAENSSGLNILKGQAAKAADAYIDRIAKGLGWETYDKTTDSFAERLFSGHDVKLDSAQAVSDFKQIYTGGSSSSGGAAPSGTAPGSGGKVSPVDIARVAYAAGFRNDPSQYQGRGLDWAVAEALAESDGDPNARNVNSDVYQSVDRGLWQINAHWHPEVSDAQAYDPAGCARAAYVISSNGTSWTPWATFNNGAGASKLAEAAQAVKEFLNGNPGSRA